MNFHILRQAARAVWRRPRFSLAVVLVLALGVAATTASFGALRAFLLRPLPFADADRLVWMQTRQVPSGNDLGVSFADYSDWRASTGAFADTAFLNLRWNGNLSRRGAATQTLRTTFCTWNLFELLGVRPALGRGFRAEDDAPGAPKVIVISHAVWHEAFGDDLRVVGQTLGVDGEEREVVGVLGPGLRFPSQTDLWIPSGVRFAEGRANRGFRPDQALGRLRAGVSRREAEAELTGVAEGLARAHPDTNKDTTVRLAPLRDAAAGNVAPTLRLVLAASACLLLIAAANIGGMFLAQGLARRREFGIRRALGATPRGLAAQVVAEALMLSVVGGALGGLLAIMALDALAARVPAELPHWVDLRADRTAWAVAFAASALAATGAALASVRRALGADPEKALRGGDGPGRSRLGEILVAGQVAGGFALLALGAALAGQAASLGRMSPGFDPTGVLLVEVNPTWHEEEKTAQRVARIEGMLARIAALPGVEAAASNNSPPFTPQRPWNRTDFNLEAQDAAGARANPLASFQTVSADYFRALRIPLLRGRAFTTQDNLDAPRVAIISRALAERLIPGGDPLGQRLQLGPVEERRGDAWRTVVGVVGDISHQALGGEPAPDLYLCAGQFAWKQTAFVVRAAPGVDPMGLLPALRREAAVVSEDTGLFNAAPLARLAGDSLWRERLRGIVVGGFSLAALLLTSAGLAALAALSVAQRRREFGIRLAVGATPAGLGWDVLRRSLITTAAGLAAGGLLVALGLDFLPHVAVRAPAPNLGVFLAAALTLLGASALVTLAPARRAARIAPVESLRAE